MSKINLPITNKHGYYEIRLESIGGLGANLSGKILAELGAIYMDLNTSSFASYGSEKRGSPVKSFIRYADEGTEMRINSPIESPHLLGLFHERMAGKMPVMAGVNEHTAVVINTDENPEATAKKIKMHAGTLYCVDAQNIAMECKTRVNMVILGALAKASKFIPLELMETAVKDIIGDKYPQALAGNLAGIKRGYEETTEYKVDNSEFPYLEYKEVERDWGYANAPIGGVNPIFGSTVSNDLTASREGYIPIFKLESCIHCGLCDSTCPDMVFQFSDGKNTGPDYHHCKGCLRCTEVCPTDALTVGFEREHDVTKTHMRNRDLIVKSMAFEDTGSNSYMESESYTTNSTK